MNTFDKYSYRILIAFVIIIIFTGTIFYHFVEKFSYLDAYYFSVVTLATVGYGDLTPHTEIGKLFTTFYIFMGVGIIAAFVSANARKRALKQKDRRAARLNKREDRK